MTASLSPRGSSDAIGQPMDSTITRERILTEASTGALLGTIAGAPYDHAEQWADRLATLHNERSLDLIAAFASDNITCLDNQTFFRIQRVFCLALPKISCSVAEAVTISRVFFERAEPDLAAGAAYAALRDWLQLQPHRSDEALTIIQKDLDGDIGIVHHVLLAGAKHDLQKYVEEALHLSHQSQPHIRHRALFALGRMDLEHHNAILRRVLERLTQVFRSPDTDQDAAHAMEAALTLHLRTGGRFAHVLESVLVEASANPSPIMRHTIAAAFRFGREEYTEVMIDAILSILRHADRDAPDTIDRIDLTLSRWDLDDDRKRVLRFLSSLLTHTDAAIGIDALPEFRASLINGSRHLLPWYVVSFLLTGHPRLCRAAYDLLPDNGAPARLDIDLETFALDSPWIPFLARKIIGYCLTKIQSASALLLSCLRAACPDNRDELESLVLSSFLLNYPTAIEYLEAAVSPADPAAMSVTRLSSSLDAYLVGLKRAGVCTAFQPPERQQQFQARQQADLVRKIWKEAKKRATLLQFTTQSIVLYGAGSIYYQHAHADSSPTRKEMSFASHRQTIDLPRLQVIDPVGLQNVIVSFQMEAPPQ